MNKDNKSQNSNGYTEKRTVDREYYANHETSRNKWFNYSDPYYLENDAVKEYQEKIIENEQKMQTNQPNDTEKENIEKPFTQLGSTTNYTEYAQQNQYSKSGINPFENTTPPEPVVDIESHVNLNTAPGFAGDHLYPGGYTRTQENSNSYTSKESFEKSYNSTLNTNSSYQNEIKTKHEDEHNHQGGANNEY